MPGPRFRDRREAGRAVAERLSGYSRREDAVVFALPRGGVTVGYELAEALDLPFDVFLVRKLGVPGHEELAFGAIASGGVTVLNEEVVAGVGVDRAAIDRVTARESAELDRRERLYRGDIPPPDLDGRTVILVDDGLATGSTMMAAIAAVRQQDPARVVVAVPLASPEICEALRASVDEVVCVSTPEPFYAVGLWYDDFRPVEDEEVRSILTRARRSPSVSR